ncbi:hypothetical protein ACIBEA_30500 [Streptomyces sp. NPDC051555]|uniref:hypothetical protein n=1 Tax=Streptomyces sp. NPDC051555 TaxID=3365657 RepID=UPI0037B56DD1
MGEVSCCPAGWELGERDESVDVEVFEEEYLEVAAVDEFQPVAHVLVCDEAQWLSKMWCG